MWRSRAYDRCCRRGRLLLWEKGMSGCLLLCNASVRCGRGKLDDFFAALDRREEMAVKMWDVYTSYLAIAVNNIHMVLDCDVVLGGYVGSYVSTYIEEIWSKAAERNTFKERDSYVKACCYKVGAAALGAALQVIENFISQI